jgi:hypothetical protein
MLHWSNRAPVLSFVFVHGAMAYQLLAGLRVLALGETGELFGSDGACKPKPFGQPPAPFP